MLSKGNTHPLLVEMQTCTATLKISMSISQKIGNQPSSGSSSNVLGYIPKIYSVMLQRHLFNYVHSNIICNSQNLETTSMLLNQRMDKENVAQLHIRVLLSSKKKNDILKFACKWMELEKNILSEVARTPKDQHGMY